MFLRFSFVFTSCLKVYQSLNLYSLYSGLIIQNEQDTQQFPLGGVGEIESGVSLSDTDGDGMPDEFEDGYGLDKNNPDDASQMAENGYTNIENYIFTLDERLDK